MNKKSIYIGRTKYKKNKKNVGGDYVNFQNERFYKISNYDQMPPFFMSIVSDSDHWMFLSSNGALTAGRINPDNALFPYYTDDRIHDSQNQTGSVTMILVTIDDKTFFWQPFSGKYGGVYKLERNIYKNVMGNKLFFEEINKDLKMCFRYGWLNSDKFGFVKQSAIINHNTKSVNISILDGIQNILPYGITRRFQLEYSTLADAYKKNELVQDVGLAIYRMSSVPTDKAEPSEALKATTVWSRGLKAESTLLSSLQFDSFVQGKKIKPEKDVRAARGAFLTHSTFALKSRQEKTWIFVADINKDASDVAALISMLAKNKNPEKNVLKDVEKGSRNLEKIIAQADGLQKTEDELSSARHFSNVLFNVLRGGIYDNHYIVDKNDLTLFINKANKNLSQNKKLMDKIPDSIVYKDLIRLAASQKDKVFEKICYEYMPLTFGRRHGDPSRPWNIFSIEIRDKHGQKILNYQGNWRDIFQNWEALAVSFPEFIESIIVKFVNATTADGYNPYRVTRDGFEWEVFDPNDPWSYIGYWGDHQIIYLLKLLEISAKHHPDRLEQFLKRDIFAFSNVPYRIKPYEKLVKDPHNTIEFDTKLDLHINSRVNNIGMDGKFLWDKQGNIYFVNFAEKVLIPALTKLTNFIPGAGIWMNTQRPEWNDANNALVGYGVSMVTLYYLRRYLAFCQSLFKSSSNKSIEFSEEVAAMILAINQVLKETSLLSIEEIAERRKDILDKLGKIGSDYRENLYKNGFSGNRKTINMTTIIEFCDTALCHLDNTIRSNKRDDNLYHAYNLIKFENKNISIRYLYEMLEGQVAVLSSGVLSIQEAIDLLKALFSSQLYRKDQNSFILYPDRTLAKFVDKNKIPKDLVESSELLTTLLNSSDRSIVNRDVNGEFHFDGTIRNARELNQLLEELKNSQYGALVKKEKGIVLDIFEKVFDHQSFTGRSGTFYKYEGLGSIYWHMVSKLLLAVGEIYEKAIELEQENSLITELAGYYYKIREGIGVHKCPQQYGAFPTDPYSHTPGGAGVQQPGMTGQVKEDILSRFMELGVYIKNGQVRFRGVLLKEKEFLKSKQLFRYYNLQGQLKQLTLKTGTLAFTFCQIPVIYHKSKEQYILVKKAGNIHERIDDLCLDSAASKEIFQRSNQIQQIDVYLLPGLK